MFAENSFTKLDEMNSTAYCEMICQFYKPFTTISKIYRNGLVDADEIIQWFENNQDELKEASEWKQQKVQLTTKIIF